MKTKIARGAMWLGGARGAINLLAFANTLLLARLLVPEDFGLVAIALAISGIIGSVTELSLSSALVQHDDPEDRHFDSAFTLNALRAALLGGLLAVLAVPVAALYDDARLAPVMFALAAITATGGLANPRLAALTRELNFSREFMLSVASKLAGFVVGVAIAWVWRSYWALIAGVAAASLANVALSYLLVPGRPRFRLSGARDLLSFSIWLSLGQIIQTMNYRFDSLAIGYFIGKPPLGAYTFGDNLASLPTREATTPIARALFPAFSRMKGDTARMGDAYRRAQALLFAVALPLGCGFAVLAEPMVHLAVGDKWNAAIFVIEVLASFFAIQTLSSAAGPLAMAMGETRALFRRDLALFAIRLPLLVAGLVLGGLKGVVIARAISGTSWTLVNMALAKRMTGVSLTRQIAGNTRAMAAVGVMVLAVELLVRAFVPGEAMIERLVALAVMIGAGGIVYAGTSLALWMAAGRPDGPEAEAIALVRAILGRINGKRSIVQ